MILLLAAAAGISFIFGNMVEGLAIGAAIIINTAIGFFTEFRAVRMMSALKQMGRVHARVRRNGSTAEVPADDLVPGDIVIVESGDIVTADLRLFEASGLLVDESAMTGESVPVSKHTDTLDIQATLAERTNMLFKGTSVTSGSGKGVVTATGMDTELGRISSLVEEAEEEITPLEKRLNRLGQRLIWITVAIAAVVAVTGIMAGREIFLMVEVSIALAVAAIPEGLPIVATVALARGMLRMASRNALIHRLSAVETLGATNIIFTDKTGTLTENRITARKLVSASDTVDVGESDTPSEDLFTKNGSPFDPGEEKVFGEAMKIGVLCSNASLDTVAAESGDLTAGATGDPLEVALLELGMKAGISRDSLLKDMPEVREEAFDPDKKMMATFHESGDGYYVAVKGAPEAVLKRCTRIPGSGGDKAMDDALRKNLLERNDRMASEGMRMLAAARRTVRSADADPYEDLTFISLIGMANPLRKEVAASIAECRDAGIKVVMVTGDLAVTARFVGAEAGIIDSTDGCSDAYLIHGDDLRDPDEMSEEQKKTVLDAKIFSRVSPEQKLNLIAIHQNSSAIVAMTGDGVNDAPALKKADIGIAMGKRGTPVAREAADMVLKDDSFTTIVKAVEHGRLIFNNIRKFVLFLLSGNASEILAVSLASLGGMPLPLLPLQILFLNMVIDVFPALALGLGEGDPSLMKKPPRDPREPVLTRSHWTAVAGYGAVLSATVLVSLWTALHVLKLDEPRAVTVSFLTIAFARLWHVFNMRDSGSGIISNDITRNPYVWGALALCAALILSFTYVPPLASILRLEPARMQGWILTAAMSFIPLIAGQLWKISQRGAAQGE